jgi:spore maturation protein CgeB
VSGSIGKKLRYLWVFSAQDDWWENWNLSMVQRRKEKGYDILGFCNSPVYLNNRTWLQFSDLDRRWKTLDPDLFRMYNELLEKIQGRDVLILYNGANLHPEFVKMLNILKVYTAGDDPEATLGLTKPISPAFDIHLINNIDAVDMYRGWGFKHVYFWPLGSLSTIDDVSDLNENNILDLANRSIPIVFFGTNYPSKTNRVNQIVKIFPEAFCGGQGWDRGFISYEEMWEIYRHSQIGWNFHNSTGPINFRTYELPAFGIMQICDNKSNLGKIFKLGKEAVGFNTLDECIELTHYYLKNPVEQRKIALEGWKRWKQEYNPDSVWEKLVKIVEFHWEEFAPGVSPIQIRNMDERLKEKRLSSFYYKLMYIILSFGHPQRLLKNFLRKIHRFCNFN